MKNKITRDKLVLPNSGNRLLLHSCCAPCSAEIMESIMFSKINFSILFYNPNIHPQREYLIRKRENINFASKYNIPFIDLDYDKDNWFIRAKGLEKEPERGLRCKICFDMRFERTALYAFENNFDTISSSLGISRWKDIKQINDCGRNAVSNYKNITYWEYNWRKKGGSERMIKISKREKFYQQEYCGCIYSLRDTNKHRLSKGKDIIRIGIKFYE
ncbi:epoxyqueuosine reductase QueH [Pantoea sp. SoEX]|uniref:epoxyqueuosine reductase QueH n=1 Tax=Pantoea sp. SoEX TaxID=2576763 RepID=UPI001356F3C3|nr:epoxyqueuosine reductase QueH [Pantoea sp. SoEX]MXP50888.1 epoxyqueuosine reductase QueH [Pantoea sp. SoEX]